VTISYSWVGSSAGIAAFTARQADFGASDVPTTAAEQAAARGGPSVQVPVDLGAEVVVYNLLSAVRLHLTGPVLAQIFLGQITSWRDPAITPNDFSIVNQPGANSYPICGYSWALVYTHQSSQATGQALVNLLDWLTRAGQASVATLGYVPLPPQIQQLG
jgi:ABC-type phosphate transport system substrate-binding protein